MLIKSIIKNLLIFEDDINLTLMSINQKLIVINSLV